MTFINNDNHTDDSLPKSTALKATGLTSHFTYQASISDSSDVDYYTLRSPTPPAGRRRSRR